MTPSSARLLIAATLLVSAWLSLVELWGASHGLLDRGMLELIAHDLPPLLSWTGRVHPPLYSVYLHANEAIASRLGVDPAVAVLALGLAIGLAQAGLVARFAWSRLGPRAAVLAAALTALGTEAIRPFEHYAVSSLATTVAALLLLRLAEQGGPGRALAAFAGLLGALWLHLSPWFLFGPLVLVLAAGSAHRRRLIAVFCGAAVVFVISGIPGLFRQLVEGALPPGGEPGGWTYGWTGPAPLLAACLLLRQRERLARPPWFALAAGLLAFAATTFALQEAQLADGQPFPASLYYFHLIEPLVALAAAAAIDALPRRAVPSATLAVLLLQGARFVQCESLLWRSPRLFAEAIQPWRWF
jgi:hypothetical protein